MALARALTAAVLAVSLLSGCFLMPREEELLEPPTIEPPEIEYREVAVTRGDIVSDFRVLAYFQPTEEWTLYFRYRGGRLKATYAFANDSVQAGQLLAELEMGDLPSQIEEAKINLEIAQVQMERSRALGADRFELRIAELGVARAQLRLGDLEVLRDNLTIASPIDGVITYKANKYEGDLVDVYYPIYRVADSRKLCLVYSGERVGDFSAGSEVTVLYRDALYAGRVAQTPASVPASASDEEKRRVVVRLSSAPSPPPARGDGAQVHVVLFRKQNVLKLPAEVIRTFQGNTFVNVLRSGIRTTKPVEIGIKTNLEAEILGGLDEGEKVLE